MTQYKILSNKTVSPLDRQLTLAAINSRIISPNSLNEDSGELEIFPLTKAGSFRREIREFLFDGQKNNQRK